MECKCPRGRLHNQQCPWYNPDVIYISDKRNDLSASEQAAQAKIYNIYQNTKNNPPEICGCGTAAEIAYMGLKTTCEEFQWIHERSSYEIFLAVLKKRKKLSFENNSQITKRPRLQATSENDATKKEDQGEQKENNPPMENATSSLEVLAEVAEVAQAQSSNSSLPDLIGDPISGADCPCEEDDDEMPPLEDEVAEL